MRGGIEKPPPSIMPCYTAIHSTTFQEPASHVTIELNETAIRPEKNGILLRI